MKYHQHIHILGIGGTFMSGLALLAKAQGFKVTGNDKSCYPPISDLLTEHEIEWVEGYDDCSLALAADTVLVGNAIKRGMPVLEAVLNTKKTYVSGPQWLYDQVLKNRRVIAVSGTHGKTTTTSMITHILCHAGLEPGFLVGGVLPDKQTNAEAGTGEWFVIEADEYDSAFFDKRPKFMHYRPEVAILNNLEFDHADIYPDLPAIQTQFQHLLKMIPEEGMVIKPEHDSALNEVIEKGVYSRLEEWAVQPSDTHWYAKMIHSDARAFEVFHQGVSVGIVDWNLIGEYNLENAMAAIAASYHAGISPEKSIVALNQFQPVKRRLEVKYQTNGITIYDDFAHHPTAIAKTLHAVKQSERHKRIFAIMEFASYSMRSGVHVKNMTNTLVDADKTFILKPQEFDLGLFASTWDTSYEVHDDTDSIAEAVSQQVSPGDAILIMSNRAFDGLDEKIYVKIDKLV